MRIILCILCVYNCFLPKALSSVEGTCINFFEPIEYQKVLELLNITLNHKDLEDFAIEDQNNLRLEKIKNFLGANNRQAFNQAIKLLNQFREYVALQDIQLTEIQQKLALDIFFSYSFPRHERLKTPSKLVLVKSKYRNGNTFLLKLLAQFFSKGIGDIVFIRNNNWDFQPLKNQSVIVFDGIIQKNEQGLSHILKITEWFDIIKNKPVVFLVLIDSPVPENRLQILLSRSILIADGSVAFHMFHK